METAQAGQEIGMIEGNSLPRTLSERGAAWQTSRGIPLKRLTRHNLSSTVHSKFLQGRLVCPLAWGVQLHVLFELWKRSSNG
jgi:hypothetical protein